MNAVTRAYEAARAYLGGLWARWGGTGYGRARYLLPGTRFDYEREAGDLWSNSVVALGLKWLGDRFPKPILRVSKIGRNGDVIPLGRHPLVDLWERPNPHYTRRTLEKAIGLSLVVDGNAFLWKRRSKGGQVVELWWLPHWALSPVYPADGSEYLAGWQVEIDGHNYTLSTEDVIHARDGIDPRNDRVGLAPLKACVREVCTVNEESGFTAAILRNAGVPSLVVSPADRERGRIDVTDAPIIKRQFEDKSGGENRGSVVVMTAAVEVKTLGFSPEQLRIDRLSLNAVARLGAAVGVAAMSLGLPDPNKTYSNLAEANRASWGTIVATQDLLREALRWQLLPEFGDPRTLTVEYDYSEVNELQEDMQSRSTRVTSEWTAGLRTRNEAREELGLEIDPEGDAYHPAVAGLQPVEASDEGAVVSASGGDVQATALNGAQIQALVEMVTAVTSRGIPAESARAMIAASFPTLTTEQVAAIVDPAIDFEPPAPESARDSGPDELQEMPPDETADSGEMADAA